MIKITWNKHIEPEHKAEIEKYLEPFTWLVPKWCQLIHINLFADSQNGSSIETRVDYEYRFIQIDFFTGWLNASKDEKRDNVIHELIHGFVNILYNQAHRTIKVVCNENEQLKELALAELSKTVESVTQDLTFVINKQFPSFHNTEISNEGFEERRANLIKQSQDENKEYAEKCLKRNE